MLRSKTRWSIMISGTGSNLNALLDTRPEHEIALVVSTSAKAYGVLRARRAGVPVWVTSSPIDWMKLQSKLEEYGVDKIFLAGFMKIVPPDFVASWQNRIVNVHPSLLPSYPGLKSIRRACEDRQPLGVTVHRVTREMDSGPHLLQRRVETYGNLDFDSCEFLVHLSEHRLVREGMRQCRSEAI